MKGAKQGAGAAGGCDEGVKPGSSKNLEGAAAQPTYGKKVRIALIGESGVGKTTLIKKVAGDQCVQYSSGKGSDKIEYTVFALPTKKGMVSVTMMEQKGSFATQVNPKNNKFFRNVDGALIIYNCAKRITGKNVPLWERELKKIEHEGRQLVVCKVANMIDLPNWDVNVRSTLKNDPTCFFDNFVPISSETGFNCFLPVLKLLREILYEPSLTIETDEQDTDVSFYLDKSLIGKMEDDMEETLQSEAGLPETTMLTEDDDSTLFDDHETTVVENQNYNSGDTTKKVETLEEVMDRLKKM